MEREVTVVQLVIRNFRGQWPTKEKWVVEQAWNISHWEGDRQRHSSKRGVKESPGFKTTGEGRFMMLY